MMQPERGEADQTQGAVDLARQLEQLAEEVRAKQAEVDSVHAAISEIHQSTSWRLTSPVRAAKAFARDMWHKTRRRLNDPTAHQPPFRPRPETKGKKISVVVSTYNHEAYIAQCIDSVLMQRGNFTLEILVVDDGSTDGTSAILRRYAEDHADILRHLPSERNFGDGQNLITCIKACAGDYIAICEGDDYWTDVYKLQKQLQFLEDHPECSMCFSAVTLVLDGGKRLVPHPEQQSLEKTFLTTEDLIKTNFIGNVSCCMYRAGVIHQILTDVFGRVPIGEWIVNMACGRLGKIGFLREPMSVYRVNEQGMWSGLSRIQQLRRLRERLGQYNEFLGHEYDAAFADASTRLDAALARAVQGVDGSNVSVGPAQGIGLGIGMSPGLPAQAMGNEPHIVEGKPALMQRESELQEVSDQLRHKQAEVESLHALISELHESTSWKLTQPLRTAKSSALELWEGLGRRIKSRRGGSRQFRPRRDTKGKKISVVVTSYNHEAHIRQCLDSVLMQKGNFRLEVVLGDDCSTDGTPGILAQYSKEHPGTLKLLRYDRNSGLGMNLKRCFEACTGGYVAICEGDDYWTDVYKLQKQLEFLEDHPECSMCFNALALALDGQSRLQPHQGQQALDEDLLTTEDLIRTNYIGNFSCCMYRAQTVRQLPQEIFDRFLGSDWVLNMACGRIGRIGFLREQMSVYRIHTQGTWSGLPTLQKLRTVRQALGDVNEFLGHEYDAEFVKLAESYDLMIAQVLREEGQPPSENV